MIILLTPEQELTKIHQVAKHSGDTKKLVAVKTKEHVMHINRRSQRRGTKE